MTHCQVPVDNFITGRSVWVREVKSEVPYECDANCTLQEIEAQGRSATPAEQERSYPGMCVGRPC